MNFPKVPFKEVFCFEKDLIEFYPDKKYTLHDTHQVTKKNNKKYLWVVYDKDTDEEIATHDAISMKSRRGEEIAIFRKPRERQTNDIIDMLMRS